MHANKKTRGLSTPGFMQGLIKPFRAWYLLERAKQLADSVLSEPQIWRVKASVWQQVLLPLSLPLAFWPLQLSWQGLF
jgi:hypothetical protein